MYTISRHVSPSRVVRALNITTRSSTTSAQPKEESNAKEESEPKTAEQAEQRLKSTDLPKLKKTIAQLDEELRQRMAGLGGDGGAAGVEYEDGRPADMKRSVRNNMFRYI